MEIYFNKDCSQSDLSKLENLERLESILFDNLDRVIFIVVDSIHYRIESIPDAQRDFKLDNPVVCYYCQDPEGEKVSKTPGEENQEVLYRELTVTNLDDLGYFINRYQGNHYILNIKNLAFVIHKQEDS
ncbi:hypothetical protein RIVM261_079910 [Rivularia sp. IAM M-261]|nr:hypothetical protein RIVM261_079910 [Rivularia sp. IAM M-261]